MKSQPSPLRKRFRHVKQKQVFVMVITDALNARFSVSRAGRSSPVTAGKEPSGFRN
jgi:hypothetical protein